MGWSPDCMKKPLACAPVIMPLTGPTEANCSAWRAFSMGRMAHGSMMVSRLENFGFKS